MPAPTVLIAGRPENTKNYENTIRRMGVSCFVSLDPGQTDDATHLLLLVMDRFLILKLQELLLL